MSNNICCVVPTLLLDGYHTGGNIARSRGIKPVANQVEFPPVGPVLGIMLTGVAIHGVQGQN